MSNKIHPTEALHRAILIGLHRRGQYRPSLLLAGTPGEIVQKLSPDYREALQGLTAEDLHSSVRVEDAVGLADQRSDHERLFDQIRRRT